MKRTIFLLLLFILLGAGAYYALTQKKKQEVGSNLSWDMNFAVEDTSQVAKIFIARRNSQNTTTLTRNPDNTWTYNGEYLARKTSVDLLLSTFKQLKVWYIPPEAMEKNMIKSLASDGIKVELYDKENKPLKVFYVGGVTNDERGTYMMIENANRPYVTHIPTMDGALRGRFTLEGDDWKDRYIFKEKVEKIKSVTVEYPMQKNESFRLEKTGTARYEIKPFSSYTPPSRLPQRKGAAESFLLQFESLGAESFETEFEPKDSIRALIPFVIVTVTTVDGKEKQAKFWPIETLTKAESGETINIRYLTDCSWGAFMLTQHHVFGPIFRGYSFFFEGEKGSDASRLKG